MMMRSKNFTFFLFCILFAFQAHAQKVGLKIGMNVGASRLFHNTDYKSTVVNNLYEYTKELFKKEGIDYSWEQFARSNELNTAFDQPRFGFSAHLTYADWPAFLIIDGMSSTSGYEKMAYSGTLGMGKDFEIGDNIGMFVTALGGYKFVFDKGWGANTLVHGVGDKSLRRELQTFFYPEKPLGSNKGNLFTIRLGIGKRFGETENLSAGIEAYGELDLTDHIQRESRMTNAGAQVYMRFQILGKEGRSFSPPAYGH